MLRGRKLLDLELSIRHFMGLSFSDLQFVEHCFCGTKPKIFASLPWVLLPTEAWMEHQSFFFGELATRQLQNYGT
jgi:hypothetical protein